MTELTSSVPAAVAALVAHLRDVAATYAPPQQVTVFDGPLGPNSPPCWVQVVDVKDWKQEPAGLGNFRRDETYDIECLVNFYDGGTGTDVAQTVRYEAYVLLEKVVAALDGDPTLGGAVRFAQLTGGAALVQGVSAIGGWAVQVPFTINCAVQLER